MTPIKDLIGYRIDNVVQCNIFNNYVDVWGRRFFWQKSRRLMSIEKGTHDIYDGFGDRFNYVIGVDNGQ